MFGASSKPLEMKFLPIPPAAISCFEGGTEFSVKACKNKVFSWNSRVQFQLKLYSQDCINACCNTEFKIIDLFLFQSLFSNV